MSEQKNVKMRPANRSDFDHVTEAQMDLMRAKDWNIEAAMVC